VNPGRDNRGKFCPKACAVGHIIRAVSIMAGSARDAMSVHNTLYKVIALHPVLVCGAIGKIEEICLFKRRGIELPIVG